MIPKTQTAAARETFIETVLNHMEEAVVATDESMLIRYWNKEAQRSFKKDFSEVEGVDFFEALHFIYCDASEESVKNNILYMGNWKGQLLYPSDKESMQAFDLSVREMKGEFSGYLMIFRNVTAQLQAEKELIGALHKEHQLHDMKNRFVCMASHEFRTPFSTILSSSNLIEKYATTEEQVNRIRHTKRIREAIHHMNAILEDFLSLTKLEEGKIVLHRFVFDLKKLVLEVVQELEMIRKPGQQVLYRHTGATEINADKKLLKMVIYNLVSNAIKFSGDSKKIEIETSVVDGLTQVTVKDEGMGISEEDQLHIFKSFYRGKNAQCVEGTGLGLHISRRYLDLMNGQIHLQSQIGKGTEVRFTL